MVTCSCLTGLSCAQQPHTWHLWETFKWPKALTQGECGTATSFGSATTICIAAVSQVLTLTLALSVAKGFALTWKSEMRLQKHPPKRQGCVGACQHYRSCACFRHGVTNAFPPSAGMPSLITCRQWLLERAWVFRTHALWLSAEKPKELVCFYESGAPQTSCWPISSLSSLCHHFLPATHLTW